MSGANETIGSNGPTYTMEEVINYQREFAEQDRKCKVENAIRTSIDKRAREIGLPVEIIKLTEKLRRRGALEAQSFHEQQTRIMMANGLVQGPQQNLFNTAGYEATDELREMARTAAAEDEGFRAGRGGLAKDANPYDVGTPESQAWVRWWGSGVAAQRHIMERSGGEQLQAAREQPKARRRGVAPVAPVAPHALPAPEPVEAAAVAAETQEAPPEPAEQPEVPRRRGRPPGSKNKNGDGLNAKGNGKSARSGRVAASLKRPRGRPPKNREARV